jgi:hypothetical protein
MKSPEIFGGFIFLYYLCITIKEQAMTTLERIGEIIIISMVIIGFVGFFGLFFGQHCPDWWVPTIFCTEIGLGLLIVLLNIFN